MGKPRLAATVVAGIAALMLLAAGCRKPSPAPSVGEPAAPSAAPEQTGPSQATGAREQLKPAPDFSLTGFDGATYSLAGLRGKPVVLNFWSSWCPHCATVVPYLESFHQHHESEGLVVLGVASRDSENDLKKKAQSLKLTYAIGISAETADAYRVSGIPHTFFINREGNLAASILGAQPKAEFETALQKIL